MDALHADRHLYIGQWVGLRDQRIVAVGDSAHDVWRAVRSMPTDVEAEIVFVDPDGGEPLNFPFLYKTLLPIFYTLKQPIYLVGGAVRDVLLGRPCYDLDFALPTAAIAAAFAVGDALGVPAYVLDRKRDTGRVIVAEHNMVLDFARFRGETVELDLRDRDFSINAMALPVGANTTAALIDPCGGYADLQARRIRPTHADAIVSDPIRALRAVRLEVMYDFLLLPVTRQAISRAIPTLLDTTVERQCAELNKLLLSHAPDKAMASLLDQGILAALLPDVSALQHVPHGQSDDKDLLAYTFDMLRWSARLEHALLRNNVSEDNFLGQLVALCVPHRDALEAYLNRPLVGQHSGWLALRWAILLHAIGYVKDPALSDGISAKMSEHLLTQFHTSREFAKTVKRIVRHQKLFEAMLVGSQPLTRLDMHRYFRDAHLVGIDVLFMACLQYLATHNGTLANSTGAALLAAVRTVLHTYYQQRDAIAPPPLLTGDDLRQMGIPPGPIYSQLLRELLEAQVQGAIASRSEAVAYVKRVLE